MTDISGLRQHNYQENVKGDEITKDGRQINRTNIGQNNTNTRRLLNDIGFSGTNSI
jgi:hypothetical protein